MEILTVSASAGHSIKTILEQLWPGSTKNYRKKSRVIFWESANRKILLSEIENGCDTFDCVTPTQMARNGALWTKAGKDKYLNAKYKDDFSAIESDGIVVLAGNYSRAYLYHLFRAKEMFAAALVFNLHNLYFIARLVREAREAIFDRGLRNSGKKKRADNYRALGPKN